MKNKKWLLILVSIAACMGLFAGCGDDSGSSSGSSSGSGPSSSESTYTVPEEAPSMAGSV